MNQIYRYVFILLLASAPIAGAVAQPLTAAGSKYPLIPYPASVVASPGIFVVTPGTSIVAGDLFKNEVDFLQGMFQHAFGQTLKTTGSKRNATKAIIFEQDNSITAKEGYRIRISPQNVTLSSQYPAGMFRAVETLRQLLPALVEEKNKPFTNQLSLPALTITDEPVYDWRGIHLDVSRHFFSINYLKKLVDLMALYKLNKLHLHLTDDQGWRIEIKHYPKLTEEGAWRTFNNQDSACISKSADNPDMAIDTAHIIQRDGKTLYGGFYTQQQMKDFVRYAASRYIDVIPEIDMPGHMMAAIHAYPYLSCQGDSKWGDLFTTPVCPCNESTFEFAENVFSEIMDIFPSEYIHLGADEVDRKSWEQSPACKKLMQKEGLKNTAELQSYFVTRMEKFFSSKGRKLIGWDEILEGGINATAYVMYWRSWVPDAPVIAAKNGNQVIMTPGNPLYFDNPPDAHSLDNIYHFKVIPDKLNAAEGKFIIGAQANLWAEYVPSENRADYLYMPRMTALAERVWSKTRDYNGYIKRLNKQFSRLDKLKVHYRLTDISGISQLNVFTDQAILDVKAPLPGMTLHYTTDGAIPSVASPALSKPLVIKQAATIKLAAFTATGLRGDIYTLQYQKEPYREPVKVAIPQAGLQCSYYKKYFKNTLGMEGVPPDSNFIAAGFAVPPSIDAPSFGLRYTGFIKVPETGIFTFYLLADDGGVLYIGDKAVVNNDGQHGPVEKSGQVALKKGMHAFKLDFIEAGGGFTLGLKYSPPNGPVTDIPSGFLKH